ncbi:hypothetical protein ACEQ8H_006439 [Pleosporales sp. CAS-2024a]
MSAAAALHLPAKACHNCRTKRWRCDRSLPSCQKCSSSGDECLGYGKLFRWNSGVASRGKMMGKSYDGHDLLKREAKTHSALAPASSNRHQQHVRAARHTEEPMAMAVQRPLIDPLMNDLDQNSRYYMHHFATQMCDVMVVYDTPGQNPIRDLIPATAAHPLLLHVMVANSAFHVFNLSRNPMGPSAYQADSISAVSSGSQIMPFPGASLESSYKDALVAKQQALSLLARNVATVDPSNIDLILVTILLFVNYALVESGRDKWRVHMEGAWQLIRLLGEPEYLQKPMSRLRLTILSDFLVFYILGSTFSFSAMPSFIPATIELDPILRYAETNNYLSCPRPLLRIMLESFALPDTTVSYTEQVYDNIQEQIGKLLYRALDFDPLAWSKNFEPATPHEDINQRVHIAAAHRSAVCIYLARVLPSSNPIIDPTSGTAIVNLIDLANDVVHHISHLKPGDALFKSICWPLFLAGAESRDPLQREWIMNTLDALYGTMFWGYLHTSKKVLQRIWKYLDEAADGEENCWVDEVKDFGNEILIA